MSKKLNIFFVVSDQPEHPVRTRRRERRMTQANLATTVGVSRQTVISIEQGDYAPSVYLALRIARALGTTVEDIFWTEDMEATWPALLHSKTSS
ncbi:helix-turn-helix transcriptional regulator [Nocardia grenadensis]|uniref:helix-turn-helix transcriptional regulator n=1 Tax=Nocardia grenadensis TaxID=931537 RepID=UPI0007A4AF85|nr:helix-turn-helix transcriptional regulator [Nocardia grenadensis]